MIITEEISFSELFKIPLCTIEEIIFTNDVKDGPMRELSKHLDNYYSQARIFYVSKISKQAHGITVKVKDGLI